MLRITEQSALRVQNTISSKVNDNLTNLKIKDAPVCAIDEEIQYSVLSSNLIKHRVEIYKLWYDVYCTEMCRDLYRADHINKILFDELEPHSEIIIAKVGYKIIGTLRLNIPEQGAISYYDDFYELNRFDKSIVGIGTKYMVHPDYRGNNISHALMRYAVDHLRSIGKKYLIIDCSPRVYKLFDKLGFFQYLAEKNCTNYGRVKVMKYEIL